MKTKHFLLVLTLGLFTMSVAFAQDQDKAKKPTDAEVTFSVDVDCANCQKKIEAKLPFEKGIKDMKVSLEKKEVWILYQSDKTDKTKLAAALLKLGYPATEKNLEQKEPKK